MTQNSTLITPTPKTRIGINGFGRIGRCTFKQFLADDRFEVAGVNDLAELDELAYLLKYDSVHGWYPRKVSTTGDRLGGDGLEIPFSPGRGPSKASRGRSRRRRGGRVHRRHALPFRLRGPSRGRGLPGGHLGAFRRRRRYL